MWSNIYSEASIQTNFKLSFGTHKNDVHIHLSQWQYWWWFWFALIWALYFLIILKLVKDKTQKFNITLNTSLRAHGKWGDFLVAIIPLTWCGNILVNSNFILRMIEWQNEGSLFTVRIQGKQWYWVYKYNSDTNYRLKHVYYNVGNNNWRQFNKPNMNEYIINNSTTSLIYDLEFKKMHNQALIKNSQTIEKLSQEQFYTHKFNNQNFIEKSELNKSFNFSNKIKLLDHMYKYETILSKFNYTNFNSCFPVYQNNWNIFKFNNLYKNLLNTYSNISYFDYMNIMDYEETDENMRLKYNKNPIRLIKTVLNKTNLAKHNNFLFALNFSNSDLTKKIDQVEQFWGFRQKKYKKLKIFSFNNCIRYDNKTYLPIEHTLNNYKKYNFYTNFKNNKHKNELFSVTLARRLLRTKRTLILPAHINITLITNSYDVVHSWFIPGLGIKLDCVPGRSTHHTFFIDNVGFYYGQCAEICGRYHHHMPIRVCALTFQHFLIWWQIKGLPRIYRSKLYTDSLQKSKILHKYY